MDDTRWDHGLTVTGEGQGLVGHAGAVLLRKLADQAGLTAALGSALARRGKFPLVDRGVALVSMAVAIALGATSMNDITVLAHHAPVLGRRAERHDGAADAGAGRSGHAGQGRPGPGPGPRARLVADRGEAGRVPVAGHRREGAGRLAGHRPGRHADHRAQRQGRSRAHVQDGLRLPSAGGLAGQYRRVAGDAAAAGQRRVEHLRRSPHRADRGDPADPRPDAVPAAGPRRRGRRQPRADHPPAVAVLPAPHRTVHLRLGDHRGR